LTSTDQWQVVKQSLERLLVVETYEPDTLETSLITLKTILISNSNISCILVDSINTFYHQVSNYTDTSGPSSSLTATSPAFLWTALTLSIIR
jgi:hypothetical protein